MKKIFVLAFFSASCLWATAQSGSCTANSTLPDSVVIFPQPFTPANPGSGISDTACVNAAYEFTITFNTPATYASPFGEIPINSIDLATEGAVTNLPTSMDYVCNPPNCVFLKDSVGCLKIFGTATPGEENIYDLGVNVLIRTSLLDLPFVFPNDQFPGNYFLHVKPAGSANCFVVGTDETLRDEIQLSVAPNPFSYLTQIQVTAKNTGNFEFRVSNMMGQQVHREAVRLYEGPNTLPFDASALPEGVYLYSIGNGKAAVSGKMIVSGR